MSSEKSVIIAPPAPKHLCPVCKTPAYSLGGIHPQCAIQQADEPRIRAPPSGASRGTKGQEARSPDLAKEMSKVWHSIACEPQALQMRTQFRQIAFACLEQAAHRYSTA